MNMRNKIFAVLALCIATSACVKEKLETIYSKQETQIDAYLTKNMAVTRDSIQLIITPNPSNPEINDTTKKTVKWNDTLDVVYNKGSVRMIKNEGTGEKLSETGAVSFYYAGYVFTSSPSTLFATNHQETAENAKFTVSDPNYEIFEADMRDTQFLEGVRNGLIGVRAGEECEILFSGKYAFGSDVFGIIPANSALLFKIWVVGVSNE